MITKGVLFLVVVLFVLVGLVVYLGMFRLKYLWKERYLKSLASRKQKLQKISQKVYTLKHWFDNNSIPYEFDLIEKDIETLFEYIKPDNGEPTKKEIYKESLKEIDGRFKHISNILEKIECAKEAANRVLVLRSNIKDISSKIQSIFFIYPSFYAFMEIDDDYLNGISNPATNADEKSLMEMFQRLDNLHTELVSLKNSKEKSIKLKK